MKTLKSFLTNESGATAIEYAMIASGISIAILVAVQGLGSKLQTMFANTSSGFN